MELKSKTTGRNKSRILLTENTADSQEDIKMPRNQSYQRPISVNNFRINSALDGKQSLLNIQECPNTSLKGKNSVVKNPSKSRQMSSISRNTGLNKTSKTTFQSQQFFNDFKPKKDSAQIKQERLQRLHYMNNVLQNNQNLLSDKVKQSPRHLKINNTEPSPRDSKQNKSRSIIPILDFDNMNNKVTLNPSMGKDSEKQNVFLDTKLFKILKKDNKPQTQWPNERTIVGPITKDLIKNKKIKPFNEKKPKQTVLQSKMVKQQNHHLFKASESGLIQNKIQKLKDNIDRLAKEEKQLQIDLQSAEDQQEDMDTSDYKSLELKKERGQKMAKKYKLYLKLLNQLKRFAQSYRINTNKNYKRYFRQRKEKKKEEKKIAEMYTGIAIPTKTCHHSCNTMSQSIAKKMLSSLIVTTINLGNLKKQTLKIGKVVEKKIQKKLDETLSTIDDQGDCTIRDSFKDILSANFKINNVKRTKKQEKKLDEQVYRELVKSRKQIKVKINFQTRVKKSTLEPFRPKYIKGFAQKIMKDKMSVLIGNINNFRIQKFGIDIKQITHELEKNVVVNTNSIHQKLILSNLPNIPANLTDIITNNSIMELFPDEPVYTPANMMKYSNKIELNTGYPNYYSLELNMTQLLNCHTKSFPLNFKVFTSHLVSMTGGNPLKKSSFTAKQLLRDPLKSDYENFKKAMDETVVCISTKNRLPSRRNCEKVIDGIKDFHFTFGTNKFLDNAHKGKTEKKFKIYFSIQYGNLMNSDQKRSNFKCVTKQDSEVNELGAQFQMLIQYNQKLSKNQVKIIRDEQINIELDKNATFNKLRRQFKNKPENMSKLEHQKYTKEKTKIIHQDLNDFYRTQNYKDQRERQQLQDRLNIRSSMTFEGKDMLKSMGIADPQNTFGSQSSEKYNSKDRLSNKMAEFLEKKTKALLPGAKIEVEKLDYQSADITPDSSCQGTKMRRNLQKIKKRQKNKVYDSDQSSSHHHSDYTYVDSVEESEMFKHARPAIKAKQNLNNVRLPRVSLRQKREFKRLFGSDQDLIKVVQTIRMVKKKQIDGIIKGIEREQQEQEDMKFNHQVQQSSETIKNRSQFMATLKKSSSPVPMDQNIFLNKSIGTIAKRTYQSKLTMSSNDIHKILKAKLQKSVSPALMSKKTLGGYDIYDIKEGDSIGTFSQADSFKEDQSQIQSGNLSSMIGQKSQIKVPKQVSVIERQFDNKIMTKLFQEIDKLGNTIHDRTLARKQKIEAENLRQKSFNLFEKWPAYRVKKEQMQDIAIKLVKRKAFWRQYLCWMQIRKILIKLAEMMLQLRQRKLRLFMRVYVAIKFKVRYEVNYCRHWGYDFEERNRRYVRKHLIWLGGLPAIQEIHKNRAVMTLKPFFLRQLQYIQMMQTMLKHKQLVAYIQNAMRAGNLNRKERIKLLEYKIVKAYEFLLAYFQDKLKNYDESVDMHNKEQYQQILERFNYFAIYYANVKKREQVAEIKREKLPVMADLSLSESSSDENPTSKVCSKKRGISFKKWESKAKLKMEMKKEEKKEIELMRKEAKELVNEFIMDVIQVKKVDFMIKFTNERIIDYAWMTMGAQNVCRCAHQTLGDISKKIEECKESIPMYEEVKKQKNKRLFDDTEVIENEYTYDPEKQDIKVRLQQEQIQGYMEQANKIIQERKQKNPKESVIYKYNKQHTQKKKMKQFLFTVNTEETHRFVFKLINEFAKFVEDYNHKNKRSKVKKHHSTKKGKKKLKEQNDQQEEKKGDDVNKCQLKSPDH